MASVPKGPGQAEVIGDLHNPQVPNLPGTYVDPVSGAESTVAVPAGADALVRMGFEFKHSYETYKELEAKKQVNEKDKE